VIVVLEDTQRLQLLQLDLSVLTAAESVLRTSVSAVTFVSTYDLHQCNVFVEIDGLPQASKVVCITVLTGNRLG